MRILLINKYHYLKGGAEKAYLDMGNILTEAGHEVAYFSMESVHNQETPWSKYFVSEVDYHEEKQSIGQKIDTAWRILWNSEANEKLQALIDEFRPDVAHAHNIYHQISPSIFRVLKKNNIPIVLTLHDYKIVSPSYTLYTNGEIWEHTSGLRAVFDRVVDGSFAKSFVCACEKWFHGVLGSYGLVDALISPSQFLVDECHKLGLRREIQVLPNPLLSFSSERKEVAPGKIVFVGRLSVEKGVDVLIRAFVGQESDKRLVIIGSGPEEKHLKMLVESLDLSERVTFLGTLHGQALQDEVMSATALVVPSLWYENLPYVVTENLAQGLVVIASASGGIPERIEDGVNGLLFPMGDTEALHRIIQRLSILDLDQMQQNARQSVDDLAPELFLLSLESLYQNLILKKKDT